MSESQPPYDPAETPDATTQPAPSEATGGGRAVASLVLGILSIPGACVPIIGLILAVIGLFLGVLDRESPNRGLAIAGIVLSSIGGVLSIINGIAGIMMTVNRANMEAPASLLIGF